MAGRDDETEELEFDDSPIIPNISQSVIVYALPQYYSNTSAARRSDPGVPREKIGSLNNTEDMTGTVRKLATSPGAYLAELRLEGRVVESKVVELKPRPEVVQYDNGQREAPPAQVGQPSAGMPAEVEARLSRIEVALVKLAERSTSEPERTTPRKPIDELKDALELVQDFQSMTLASMKEVIGQQSQPTPTTNSRDDGLDDEDRALIQLIKNPELRDKALSSLRAVIGNEPLDSKKNWWDVLGSVLEHQPALALRAFKIVERLVPVRKGASVDDDDDEEDVEGEEAELNALIVSTGGDVRKIVAEVLPDLALNAEPARAAVIISAFAKHYPELAGQVGLMLSAPSAQVLELLISRFGGGPELKQLPHALKWIDSLKALLAGNIGS